MDAVIQGLTQSAIVQKLSETEHHVKRFTKDIPDNAPFRSLSKIEINSFRGSQTDPDSTQTYRVNRNGYLNRMYLKVQIRLQNNPIVSAIRPTRAGNHHSWGAEVFGNFFDSVTLIIGGKHMETMYTENILYNAFSRKGPAKDHIMKGLRGMFRIEEEGFGREDALGTRTNIGKIGDFIIPLDFSMFRFFKDSIDTNFMPEIQVEFSKKRMVYLQEAPGNAFTKATLVCLYHNVHNHFRTNIRNANFDKETSTLISNLNYRLREPSLKTITEEVVQTDTQREFPKFATYTYDLPNDLLATDILVSFDRNGQVFNPLLYTGDMKQVPRIDLTFPDQIGRYLRFIVRANGKVLFDKNYYEMNSSNVNNSSNEIQDFVQTEDGHRIFQAPTETEEDGYIDTTSIEDKPYNPGFPNLPVHMRVGPSLYRIPFSLYGTDEFFNGGLDLTSLSNVQLIIESDSLIQDAPQGSTPPSHEESVASMTPNIVIRHKKLIRIDGKTGVVSY